MSVINGPWFEPVVSILVHGRRIGSMKVVTAEERGREREGMK